MIILNNFFIDGIGKMNGLFSLDHLFYIIIAVTLIISTILFTKKLSNETIIKYIKVISIIVLVLEILKIIWNLTLRLDVVYEDYVPLYLCSFFIYFSLIFSFTNKDSKLNYISRLFLFYTGFAGGVAFILFPTTALLVFPFLHVLSFHSLIYHVLMVIVSIWMLRFLKPDFKDFKYYASVLLSIEVVLIIVNLILGSNFMMLNKPFEIIFLEVIYELAPIIYPAIMAIGQVLLTFFVPYYIIKFIKK